MAPWVTGAEYMILLSLSMESYMFTLSLSDSPLSFHVFTFSFYQIIGPLSLHVIEFTFSLSDDPLSLHE
jgi:hypothetical protein